MIVEIAPEKRTGIDRDTFSYLVPKTLIKKIQVGSICQIPFGKRNLRGVVFELYKNKIKTDESFEIKDVISVDDTFVIPSSYLKLMKWISKYYLCSLGEASVLFLPPDITNPRKQNSDKNSNPINEQIILTPEQNEVFQQLAKNLIQKKPKPALLFGVTGSGKTEIYLKLVERNLKQKKQTIVLVPEIMLTPQIVEKFESTFPNQICLIHSGLSKSEKFNAYKQFYLGEKNIMIGPRSALLVPSNNLGLIIIDEEQEDAYKQEKNPRYHAVDLAFEIVNQIPSLLLLGTATPRIETFHMAKEGKIDLFIIESRYKKTSLPTSKIVDLKHEIKNGNLSPISEELQKEITNTLDRKKQVLLFLNRRGVSTFVSCRECGEIILCPKCNIPLVYHISFGSEYLNCHHCDFKALPPKVCPKCKSLKIKYFGAGVDKIENEVRHFFPEAIIKKVDAKSLQNKGEYENLFQSFKNHKIDILIGTQILAKGLDIPNVDLVGVISADTGLHMPHFRASEKTFQILTQVSGRSGRKESIGHTIIQSYWPESSSIVYARNHNFEGFYNNEITERSELNYPPFCHLIRVISQDKNKIKTKSEIEEIAQKLKSKGLNLIGPGPCFLSKINNNFRYHLIIKTTAVPNKLVQDIYKEFPYATWDVDPVDLL